MSDIIRQQLRELNWGVDLSDLTLDGTKRSIQKGEFKGGYVGTQNDKVTSLTIWNYKTSDIKTFKEELGPLTPKAKSEMLIEQNKRLVLLKNEQKEFWEELSQRYTKIWEQNLEHVDKRHPYLEEKGLYDLNPQTQSSFLGARIVPEPMHVSVLRLIIPMRDLEGKLWGYQTITNDKRFADGQRVEGTSHLIGKLHPKKPIWLFEGFATAATFHLITGQSALVCFNAKNLSFVAKDLRVRYREMPIVISGDNDWHKYDDHGEPYQVGLRESLKAAHLARATVCMVSFSSLTKNQMKEHTPTDWNDLYKIVGPKEILKQYKEHNPLTANLIFETEYNGFYRDVETKQGIKKEARPIDLAHYFYREKSAIIVDGTQRIYTFNGTHFEPISKDKIKAFAFDHFKIDLKQECSEYLANEFYGAVIGVADNCVDIDWFIKSTKNKVNFLNGVLDMNTGKLSPHSPKYGFKYVLPYNYDEKATCETFDRVMNKITCNRSDLSQVLLEFTGYTLAGSEPWLQKALILVGDGANGKSTFLNVIEKLCGKENVSFVSVKELTHEYNRAFLDGAICNLCEENTTKRMDTEEFKKAIGGGELKARAPYERGYSFRCTTKFMFAFNQFETAWDESYGFLRRLIIVPFDAVFTKEDPDFDSQINEKLEQELSGIFNKVFKAYKDLMKRGYIVDSKTVEQAVREFAKTTDRIGQFIEDAGIELINEGESLDLRAVNSEAPIIGEDEFGPYIETDLLYKHYKEWCSQSGERYPESKTIFVRKILKKLRVKEGKGATDKILSVAVKRISGRNSKILRGVKWLGIIPEYLG